MKPQQATAILAKCNQNGHSSIIQGVCLCDNCDYSSRLACFECILAGMHQSHKDSVQLFNKTEKSGPDRLYTIGELSFKKNNGWSLFKDTDDGYKLFKDMDESTVKKQIEHIQQEHLKVYTEKLENFKQRLLCGIKNYLIARKKQSAQIEESIASIVSPESINNLLLNLKDDESNQQEISQKIAAFLKDPERKQTIKKIEDQISLENVRFNAIKYNLQALQRALEANTLNIDNRPYQMGTEPVREFTQQFQNASIELEKNFTQIKNDVKATQIKIALFGPDLCFDSEKEQKLYANINLGSNTGMHSIFIGIGQVEQAIKNGFVMINTDEFLGISNSYSMTNLNKNNSGKEQNIKELNLHNIFFLTMIYASQPAPSLGFYNNIQKIFEINLENKSELQHGTWKFFMAIQGNIQPALVSY